MNDTSEKTAEQTVAFQKIWLESMSKVMQSAFTFRPDSAPPEMLREIRSGIFQALARSWEEFMRSPQFLDGMKQWTEQVVSFRKMSNDFMANVRNELQSPSREDIDTIMLAVRHMEKRLLDRVEDLSAQVNGLKERLGNEGAKGPAARVSALKAEPPKNSRQPSPQTAKGKTL